MKALSHRFLLCVLVLASALCLAGSALAQTEVSFVRGQQTEVFSENDVRLYLTGEVDDSGMMWLALSAVIENHTSRNISVSYTGVCNGWSVDQCVMGGSGSAVRKGAKGKSYLWLLYDQLDLKRFSDLQDLTLDFIISDSDTQEELFRVTDVSILFGSSGQSSGGASSASQEQSAAPAAPVLEYYDECPILPRPECLCDVYQSGRSSSSVNGKLSSVTYRYSLRNQGDSLSGAFSAYVEALRQEGFTVSLSGTAAVISSDGKRLGTFTQSASQLEMDLIPGNEGLTAGPSGTDAAAALSDQGDKRISLGDTITTKTCTLKLESVDTGDKIYSYGRKKASGIYFQMEPVKSGQTFLYVYGTFTNTGSAPVDIRHIYATMTLDGQYVYDADVCGVTDGGADFINYVSPRETVGVYIYAELPPSMARPESATLRLGFTDSFDPLFISSGLPDFSRCSETYMLALGNGASSGVSGLPLNTASPAPAAKKSMTAVTVATPTPGPTATPRPAPPASQSLSGGSSAATPRPTAKPTPTPRPTDTPKAGPAVGDTVVFGSYEQDGNTKNGKEPLEWMILDIDGDKALLITAKVVDYVKNTDSKTVLWSKCAVRTWMNDKFYKAAFSSAERKAILTTQVHTPQNPYYLRGGCDTKDRLFSLSMEEVIQYFETSGKIGDEFITVTDPRALTEATPVALQKAVKQGECTAFDTHLSWLLRDTGDTYCMVNIFIYGNDPDDAMLNYMGDFMWDGVRPAMWVKLSALPQ